MATPQGCSIEEVEDIVLFVGNPGTGKSTLLNSLVGENKFKAGVKYGAGLSTALQKVVHNGVAYCDTPGLNDTEIMKKAAEEITKALKMGGEYRLFFVVTLEGGRVRAVDAATLSAVLRAVKHSVVYNVIINKLPSEMHDDLCADENDLVLVLQSLTPQFEKDDPRSNSLAADHLLLQRFDELESKKFKGVFDIKKMPGLKEFVDGAERQTILQKDVTDVQTRAFDKDAVDFNKRLEELLEAWKDVHRQREEVERYKREREQKIGYWRSLGRPFGLVGEAIGAAVDHLGRVTGIATAARIINENEYASDPRITGI